MRKKSLTRFLESLNSRPLDEFAGTGSPAGAAMDQRPDMSGFRGRGAKYNFTPRNDQGPGWPYEDDEYMMYGRSMGNKGRDRGTRPGEDMSGQAPTPSSTYDMTWQTESPDYDETQRHGDDKYRNVWRDTPDGREWTKMNNESMGSPMQIGPVAPMDGPQHNVLNFSGSVDDMLPDDDMRGPQNMWGGAGTIPGTGQGWASSPTLGDDPENIWKTPKESNMRLREFFCPEPVPVEEIDNPEQDHFEDQSDDEVEGQMDTAHEEGEDLKVSAIDDDDFAGEEDGSFSDRLGGTSISIVPNLVGAGEFVMTPDKMGAARGTYGIHTDSAKPHDLVDKRSAWDVIELLVQNIKKSEEDF